MLDMLELKVNETLTSLGVWSDEYMKKFHKEFDAIHDGVFIKSKLYKEQFNFPTDEIYMAAFTETAIICKKFQYVYVIKGTHKGESKYKIGRSIDYRNRAKTFNVKIPFDIETEFLFYVIDSVAFEGKLHKIFSEKRITGEWFDLNHDDLKELLLIGVKTQLDDTNKQWSIFCKEQEKELNKQKRSSARKRWGSKDKYMDYLSDLLVMNNIKFEEYEGGFHG